MKDDEMRKRLAEGGSMSKQICLVLVRAFPAILHYRPQLGGETLSHPHPSTSPLPSKDQYQRLCVSKLFFIRMR